MIRFDFQPAAAPTLYFIGVTTEHSSIMNVYPKWAEALDIPTLIRGIDLSLHAPSEEYRRVVEFLKCDPLSMGALVTTHKLDLFHACRDLFDYVDPFAEKLNEVSCLSKWDGLFCAHAKDPISSGLALEHFIPSNFWRDKGGEVLLIGAGGSSLAMSLYLTQEKFCGNYPRRITIANRSAPRLASAQAVLADLGGRTALRFVHASTPEENDALIAALPSWSLVVNATGLGKDAPGSPTTNAVRYPAHSYVWEINYRGELVFMDQAQAQEKERALTIEDGWVYFIHGWTQVISEVYHFPIGSDTLETLSRIAWAIQNG